MLIDLAQRSQPVAADLGLGRPAQWLDTDLLVLFSRLVLGLNCEDAVLIEGERHLDLRHAARPLANGDETELAEKLVGRISHSPCKIRMVTAF